MGKYYRKVNVVNNKILLSIIVPHYNNKNLLKKQISNLNKMFKSFPVEFIYIDDGSTDGTYENLLKLYFYNKLIDPKIYLF